MKKILCCKFQTTTLLIDDNRDLQLALSLSLPPENGPYRFINHPQEALSCLLKETPLLTSNHLNHLEELKGYANRASKIDKIAVVFMDYQMPFMNGVEVFERISLPCTEKIMLTAMADEKIAVQAFNRGLINQYISKHDPEFVLRMQEALEIGKRNYFQRSTQTLYSLVTQDEQETALTDPVFISFFRDLKKKLGIVEYYLLDGIGSFLMFDSQKKRYKLDAYTKERFQSFLETHPPLHRSIHNLKGRQMYHCMLNGGSTAF